MPIYEYCCSKCDKDFEELVRPGSSKTVECPCCGSAEVEKKFSAFAFSSGSKGSEGSSTFRSSASSSGCGSCASHSCSTCHG
ncbi:MAG: zinc ribbon domain-containing protein [Vulcanimicrobiota bacterium]